MASSSSLQFRDLDRASSEFPIKLTSLLRRKDCTAQVQQQSQIDPGGLVEDLDLGLNVLNPASLDFDRCFFELREVCGDYKVLPASHVIQQALLDMSNDVTTSGASADMYEGTLEDTKVCVKRLRFYLQDNPEKVKSFYHEIVVWKCIRHQNIVPFRGVTLEPLQLVSDWMEHGDLPGFLKKYPSANRLGLLQDVAEALNYIHSRNLVHGSVMGAHILVDRLRRARVTGFSLATVHPNQVSSCSVSELHVHSTRWTAPEVLEGTGPLTRKADVFSFAMVMIEVFTGMAPFNDFRSLAVVAKISNKERPPRPAGSTLPDDVWALMQRCWEQEPESRPEMGAVLRDLAPSLLRSLFHITEVSPEFQVALSQFYEGSVRKECINRLNHTELEEFINLLDLVSDTKELNGDVLQQTLYNLREVCSEQKRLPKFRTIPRQFSTSTDKLFAESRYAEVWNGQPSPGEGSDGTMEVCIKVIKLKGVLQEFYGDVALWAKLDHPNILRCFGVTVDPPQVLMKWMPNGEAMKYVQEHKRADRVSLLIDTANGLDYLHSHGVTHGNLKHQNILVDSAGHARLSDIGFARLIPTGESGFDWALAGGVGCRWAAPEIFQKGKFTQQSDVFTFGFITAEIFTGSFLWEDLNETEVKSRILNGERPSRPEGKKKHALATNLWRIFAKCWGKDPAGRVSVYETLDILRYIPRRSGSYNSKMVVAGGKDHQSQEQIDELDKMLDTNMVFVQEQPKLLNRLCKMCDDQRTLPGTMVIPENALILPPEEERPRFEGGFGIVYKGTYRGRAIAIKSMKLYTTSNLDEYLSRFCREAVAWRHLRHPNVLPLLGATLETPDVRLRYALVSEWMDNGDINSFIKHHGDVNRVLLLVDVAHGLEYLHDLDFVHGDLKGANILVTNDQRACLADFGLSTITSVVPHASSDTSLFTGGFKVSTGTATSLMHHTPGRTDRWASPELLDPEAFKMEDNRPTRQSDCYALGMVVYEVLCSKMPYEECRRNIVLEILNGVRPSKPDAAATLGFTDGLWWIVKCCWLEDRRERPDVKTVLTHLTRAAWIWDRRRCQRRSVPVTNSPSIA